MDWNDLIPIQQFDLIVIHAMLVGQTMFMVMWSRLPWWENWIGRALWVKSAALWLLIAVSIVLFWYLIITDTEWKYADHLTVGIHCIVTFGIFSQVLALWYETQKDRNHVSVQKETNEPA